MWEGGRRKVFFFLRSSFVELEWEEKVEINKLNPKRTILLLLCKVRTGSRRAIVMAFVLVGLLHSNSKGSKQVGPFSPQHTNSILNIAVLNCTNTTYLANTLLPFAAVWLK